MICDKTDVCFFDKLESKGSPCKNETNCIVFCDKRSDATCSEKNKSYHLINADKQYTILSIHIDGGVISNGKSTPSNISKCDYLFLSNRYGKPIAVLIELKGTDINKAIEQLDSTLTLFGDTFSKCSKVYGRIVFSGGTPNIQNTPKFIALNRKLKKKQGSLIAAEKLIDRIETL